ncbi:hypothetical protein ACFY1U_33335 [Streptomyces sp. NPDC001351]|uniref:hypothetical protein n=1 Tax=Streptomyces sp. NPDC001351 TaxID=3364564 RepID=UPI0036778E80
MTVHQVLLEELDTDERYDVIVSGLPLTNFSHVQVERIMARYRELLPPRGSLTYFAYIGTRMVVAAASWPSRSFCSEPSSPPSPCS